MPAMPDDDDGANRARSGGRADPTPAAAAGAAVFAGTPHLVVVTDAAGVIVDLNPAAERGLGYARDELVGRAGLLALHDPDEIAAETARLGPTPGGSPAAGMEAVLGPARRGQPDRRDWTYRRKDGGRLPVAVTVLPLPGADGVASGFVAMAADLSERRAHERTLIGARAEAVARRAAEGDSQAKTRFLAAASHDLRQPLQSAVLFAEALLPHVTVGRGLEVLVRLEKSLEALRSLLDRLLDISKLDGGAVQPRPVAFAINRLLDEIDESYAPRAAARGLGWSVARSDAVVASDPELLGRILRNLVENALRYTERGAVAVTVAREDDAVALAVRDTGIGIPEGSLEAIFHEFHRVDHGPPALSGATGSGPAGSTTEADGQGVGLGLAIVRRLSMMLDHPVAVRSRLGEGSTFSVRVALAASSAPAATEDAPLPTAPEGGGRLVLVVEDDPLVCAALSAMLGRWGYATVEAASAADAQARLDAMAPQRPHVVLADHHLRDGATGAGLLHAVRRRFDPPVRTILLTGDTGALPLPEASLPGVLVLRKPVAAAALRRALLGEAV